MKRQASRRPLWPQERRSSHWAAFLRDWRVFGTERRQNERRTGFDRRARVQPAYPALQCKTKWPHN